MTNTWTWWASEMQKGICENREKAEQSLAGAIGRDLSELVTASGSDQETYYYETEEDRDADDTGAYAWAVYPTPENN